MRVLRRLAASSVLVVFLAVGVLAGDIQGPGVTSPPPPPTNSVVDGTTQGSALAAPVEEPSGEIESELKVIIISLLVSNLFKIKLPDSLLQPSALEQRGTV